MTDCEVSVVIPFADDEEHVGALTRRVAAHLRALGHRFEILLVDEESGDNSVPLLSLLRSQVPELRVLVAPPRRGFAAGSRFARGRVLWLIDVARAAAPFAPFSRAYGRVLDGNVDVVVVAGRYIVCRRARAWPVATRVRGRGPAHERRFLRAARRDRLVVENPSTRTPPALPILRFLGLAR